MATVIDALLIQLGFDTKPLVKGQAEADESLNRVRKGAKSAGDGLDKMGKDGAQAIRSLAREAVAFFAVLTAGKSLKAFVEDNTTANVALQNMARNLGVSAQSLATWQGVAQEFGGTASDVSGSMQSLVSQFQTIEGRQNLARVFGQMHVSLIGANGQLRSMNDLIPDLAQAAQKMGPALFSALGQQAGFSQGFINMLEQNPQRLMELYKALQQYAPTDKDAEASQQLLESWTLLTAQSSAFGRSILTDLTPELVDMMNYVSKLVDNNEAWIRQDIAQYAKQIGDAIQNIDWQKVEQNISAVIHDVDDAAKAVGGWKDAVELLFALWVGSKFVSVLANIVALGRAGGASAAALAPLLRLAAAGYVADFVVGAVDPKDKLGRWIDRNIPGASWLDNQASRLGIGLSYADQGLIEQPGVAYKAGDILGQLGITQEQWETYSKTVAGIEGARYDQMGGAGGKYAGRYQMSRDSINESAAYLGEQAPTQQQFLSDPQMQERYFEAYNALNNRSLVQDSPGYRNADPAKKLAILGYAWNQGAGGAENWLSTGITGRDAFGTPGTRYADNVSAAMQQAQEANSTTNHNNTTTINAPVTINAPGGNAKDIAHEVNKQMASLQTYARQTNSGMQ